MHSSLFDENVLYSVIRYQSSYGHIFITIKGGDNDAHKV